MPSLVGAVVTKSVSSFVSGSGGVRVIGVANSRTGHAVNMIGDYNKDGLQDFAVSASNFTVGLRHGCGLVIIVLGQTGSWTEIDLETVTSSSSIRRIIGGTNNDNAGTAVGPAGDVNKDGFADVLIGAGGVDLPSIGTRNVGAVYVIFGMASTSAFTDIDLASFVASTSNGYTIYGPFLSTFLGNGLLNIRAFGDMNGDSIDDFAISAPNAASNTGLVWFIYGYTTTPADLYLSNLGSAGVLLTGAGTSNLFGCAIDTVGDFDGDGKNDVVVGAYGYSSFRGFAYLIYGTGAPTSLSMSAFVTGPAGIRFLGAAVAEEAGSSVSGAGDINGDGKADLLIGAPAADPSSRSNAGRVYAVFGRSAKLSADFTLSTLTAGTEGFTIIGAASSQYLGWTVSRGGDLDQDGIDDYLLGAYNGLGRVYVLYGSLTAPSADIDINTYTGKIAAFSGGSSALLGYSLSGGVDVSGDGVPDILISSRNADVTPAAGGTQRNDVGSAVLMAGPVWPFTDAPTKSPSQNPTSAPSDPTVTPTTVPSVVPSKVPSVSPSRIPSKVPSVGPSVKPSTLPSVIPSVKPSVNPSMVPSKGPSVLPSRFPSAVPSKTASASPSAAPGATSAPSINPSTVPSVRPSNKPSVVPSKTPSVGPSALPSTVSQAAPSVKPNVVPSQVPSTIPSLVPSRGPSLVPSVNPSVVPSKAPSAKPSMVPSTGPSVVPSTKPSVIPSMMATLKPTSAPTSAPTADPTITPSAAPSEVPSMAPSQAPSEFPSLVPSIAPSQDPSAGPSAHPSVMPSAAPSLVQTVNPSTEPSASPSTAPTLAPTGKPSAVPTTQPTAAPTDKPYTVVLGVEQDIYFISKADYDSQKTRCNLTIQHTVAASMDGVVPQRVTEIVVEETEAAKVGNMRALATSVLPPPVSLKYKVTVHDPVLSAEVLTAQLKAKVLSGEMDNAFRAFAVMFNATKMQNGTFTEPKVTLLNDSDNSEPFPGVGFIVGVTVGGLLFLCLMVLFVCAYRRKNKVHTSVAVTDH
eukprot:CAMPEP_0184976296 /NCGR_PEP_ID=MMETSP1098-20130426/7289_1 /TAXON_ID=89044 /ORGANISM="Spumella elongata, Strain CCAP 955/1" /LENGTH=1020 /DNA_ID=CAMNT_0027499141 /DNA_START=90 /DNA_END=3152 /DNA_ORIENTATION=+